ncbi:MAG: hypothetical protein IV090_22285 [Candidatus Sericytochromatia bacterium]|nr:hypothetical protein [Candidatus Sericytochromatia bacterium]
MPTLLTFQRWSYVLISTALALLILASFGVEKTIRQQLQVDVRLNPLQMGELYYCQATIRERPAEPV